MFCESGFFVTPTTGHEKKEKNAWGKKSPLPCSLVREGVVPAKAENIGWDPISSYMCKVPVWDKFINQTALKARTTTCHPLWTQNCIHDILGR
jgi:L,D-peptidoglycan transpeptidase YkuD (ErfK/YbiS/YcfS/YnhG family)